MFIVCCMPVFLFVCFCCFYSRGRGGRAKSLQDPPAGSGRVGQEHRPQVSTREGQREEREGGEGRIQIKKREGGRRGREREIK